ncbi:WD40 domain protein (macronuclear) [Tetrahymena thermophila SB210]|uniref:WD40 domain protein n=1 Tax=Tetrahymena thermophila (strain SB210) TaxID=312017 RepID=Q23AE9_TETTS|nr:WD40 domain protein [Tetrahymena thermophila SB210]EAR93543.3 WD40 domain protein [Tetrahymena thermophila SB210]|eukprot:XP_001013788.3 WD40 domain protein [Tetrahymena thermophila SB210]
MAERKQEKRPSKIYDYEDNRQKKDKGDLYTFGQLEFADYPNSKYKLAIRTFFGNPETEVFCVRFDQDDQFIAAGCSDGSVKIFNISTGKLEHNLSGSSGINATPTTCLRWRPPVHNKTKQVLVSVNSDGSIIHWHAPSGKQLHRLVENNHSIMCLDYNPEGSSFVTAGKDFHIRVYDEDTKSVAIDFPPADWNQPGHSNRVFSCKFLAHDPNLILSGGWDSNVHLWDIREKKSVATIYGPSLSGDSLDYKDGLILTGSYRNDKQMQLWDLKTRKLFKDIEWSNQSSQVYVYASQFSKIDSKTLIAGSSGINEFVVFDTNEYKPVSAVVKLREGIYGVDYGNVTNKVAFGGGEGVTYILTLQQNK